MSKRRVAFMLGFVLAAARASSAVTVEPRFAAADASRVPPPQPARLADALALPPFAVLAPASVGARDELAALARWNLAHRTPLRNGFFRALPRALEVRLGPASPPGEAEAPMRTQQGTATAAGPAGVRWTARVRVEAAYRLRLHLARVHLPAAARLWVYGGPAADTRAAAFGPELVGPAGDLWTPSVGGPEITVEVQLPPGAAAGPHAAFDVDKVLEIVGPGLLAGAGLAPRAPIGPLAPIAPSAPIAPVGPADSSCLIDASCIGADTWSGISLYRAGIAELHFIVDRGGEVCTGGLLNDTLSSGTPYLLTANHCISTQAAASTLEAFFDDVTASCNGAPPLIGLLPRSNGATLLATGLTSDFAFLRLFSVPANRTFLGWSSDRPPNRTELFRLSHPCPDCPDSAPLPQTFSDTLNDTSPPFLCGPTGGRPLENLADFLYSDTRQGAVFGGSSGSPVMTADGRVVGQLFGTCGSGGQDPCLSPASYNVIDGAFAATYPSVSQWLNPTAGCAAGAANLCLDNGRFRVEASWTNQFNGTSGTALAISSTDSTGFFFFTDPSNYELIVKILNINGVIKVFYGELTDLHFSITVTDTFKGTAKTYQNTPGDCGAIDENAFTAASPAPDAAAKRGSCAPGSNTLCLFGRRFAIGVTWMNQFNGTSGQGSPRNLSDLSGLFSFTDPADVELVMKVVDFGDRTAFFWAALSDFEYDITVLDTVGGTTKTYHNPAGNYCGGLDNDAFPP